MESHFSSLVSTFKLFPPECFNFQQPYMIPTTRIAATTPATTPPRKEPAPVETIACSVAVTAVLSPGDKIVKIVYALMENTDAY